MPRTLEAIYKLHTILGIHAEEKINGINKRQPFIKNTKEKLFIITTEVFYCSETTSEAAPIPVPIHIEVTPIFFPVF